VLLVELKDQIIKNIIKPIYIFTGEEIAIMNIYINKIIEISKASVFRAESVSSVYTNLQLESFINSRMCYIIRDDKEYMQQEKIWMNINNGSIQKDNIIILVYNSLDKRSKFYKQHTDIMVDFEKLSPEILSKYIDKEIQLNNKKSVELANLCDCDYNRILFECDKIKNLAAYNGYSIDTAYDTAIKEKLITIAIKDIIFDFIDVVCRRQKEKSFKLLKDLEFNEENKLAIIGLLYSNFRNLLLVKGCGNIPNITEVTGLTNWQIKMAKEKGNFYSISELVDILRIIREVEKNIKIGLIETNIAVDYILVNIL